MKRTSAAEMDALWETREERLEHTDRECICGHWESEHEFDGECAYTCMAVVAPFTECECEDFAATI